MKRLRTGDSVYLVSEYYHGSDVHHRCVPYEWNGDTKKAFAKLGLNVDYFTDEQHAKSEVERRYRADEKERKVNKR